MDISQVRQEIERRRAENPFVTYASLADDYGVNKGLLWRILNRGHEPKDPVIRQRLNLPIDVSVTPVNGSMIPPGSQVHHADTCVVCGKPYISNHPLRRKCFICGKYRGKTP